MKAAWFSKRADINWSRLWLIVGVITTFWAGLASITMIFPAFDIYYKIANIILSAVSSALLFVARGNKYAVNRQEPPQDGKP